MAFDKNELNAYTFIKGLKERLADRLEERLESGELFPLLETEENLEEHVRKDTTDIDWNTLGPDEKDAVIKLKELGRQLGSDPGAYASGVLMLTFKNKQAVEDFANAIENDDYPFVDTYEIEAHREDLVNGFVEDEEYDFGDIMFDKDFEFTVSVYLDPDIVAFPAEEIEVGDDFEWDDDEDNGYISEVRRRIKINFRGKKRIKMQCRPGFKWDATAKTCKKITGAQGATMRKAMRRMALTKKSMGQSFKARVLRKTRKAKRFRKSYGLR